MAGREPTVVFLDDLQWGDDATLELLPSLAASVEDRPLLFLGVYRSDEVPRSHPLRRMRAGASPQRAARGGRAGAARPASDSRAGLAHPRTEPGPTARPADLRPDGGRAILHRGARGRARRRRPARGAGRHGRAPGGSRRASAGDRAGNGAPAHRPALPGGPSCPRGGRGRRRAARSRARRRPRRSTGSRGGDRAAVPRRGRRRHRGLSSRARPRGRSTRRSLGRGGGYTTAGSPRRLERAGAPPQLVGEHWLAARKPERARPALLAAAEAFCAVHAYRDASRLGRRALELWPEGEDEAGRLVALERLGLCAELSGELPEAARVWEEVVDARRAGGGSEGARRDRAASRHRLRARRRVGAGCRCAHEVG